MNHNREDAQALWRHSKKVQNGAKTYCESILNRAEISSPQLRTSTPASSKPRRVIHDCRSAPSLASVGLGNFKFSELHAMIQANLDAEEDGLSPGEFPVPESFQGLSAEEHRPPRELFTWNRDEGKRSNKTNRGDPFCCTSPTNHSPRTRRGDGTENTNLPGLRRSASVACRPFTLSGIKRKGLVTTGGKAFRFEGKRASGSRRRGSSEGTTPSALRKNYSAVRATDGMWQFIARAKNIRETPVSRGDAFALIQEFETAMAAVKNEGVGVEGEGRAGASASPMHNDMHALQQEVGRKFGARAAVAEAVQIMNGETKDEGIKGVYERGKQQGRWRDRSETGSDWEQGADYYDGDAGGCDADASALSLTGEWVRSAVGLSPEDWASIQSVLGGCLFEQKWLDLTCGELCEQVTVACLPHGQLLQEIRRRSASVFNRLHRIYSDLLWVLDRCVASLLRGRRERKRAEEDWTRKLADSQADYEARIKAIHDSHGSEEQEQARAKREAKAQVERMGNMLRALNGIFKTMQADGKAMTEVDLKDRCRALEQELSARNAEFRALKEKHVGVEAEVRAARADIARAKLRATKAEEELERRQSLVKGLMDNEAKRLTEIEAMKAGTDAVGGGDWDDGKDGECDDRKQKKTGTGAAGSRKYTNHLEQQRTKRGGTETAAGNSIKQSSAGGDWKGRCGEDNNEEDEVEDEDEDEEEIGSSVLCIKCRKALDDLGNIADALEKERRLKGETRLQCHGYRLLLPNLKGRRPPRTVAWVRTVMRAILRSKVWDDSVLRYKQDLRARFPEFAYSWFEPPRVIMTAANASGRSSLVRRADEDRWGLYYGVKTLARESPEATIFWHLLNETNGEDYITFLVYCLSVVEGTAGVMLREQWGVGDTCTDLHTLRRKVDEAKMAQGHGSSISGDGAREGSDTGAEVGAAEKTETLASGKEVVWLLSSDAVEIVHHVLVKAVEEQKRKVLEATKAISVSCQGRLPDQKDSRSSTCLDLFLFLRILLHSFKEEQVNRRAAVRLMFETAATGILTDGNPIYGNGIAVNQSTLAATEIMYRSLVDDKKATVDLPQFMVIARTLWPEVTTSDAVAVFRDAHEETNGEVDYQAFLKLADRWQFFSNALQLPVHMPSRADRGRRGLDMVTKKNLGALVHCHYSLMRPAIERLGEMLPESAVKQLVKCQRAVERELREASAWTSTANLPEPTMGNGNALSTNQSVGGVSDPAVAVKDEMQPHHGLPPSMSMDGTRPLAAYRRLLAMMYHVRNVRHESGPGYEPPLEKEVHVVQKTEAEFRAFEAVFFDLNIDPRFQTHEIIRARLAATKLQRAWRRKLLRSCGVPLDMLALFRPGYLRGVGGTISRTVHRPPYWVQQQIAEAYTAKLRADSQVERNGLVVRGATYGPSGRPLHWVIFNNLLRQWGTPELAERAAHDLFFNVHSLGPALSRLRLFGAFSGCLPPGGSGPSNNEDTEFHNDEALAFYMRAVVTFHRVRGEMEAAAAARNGENSTEGGNGNSELESLGLPGNDTGAVVDKGRGGDGGNNLVEELDLSTMMDDGSQQQVIEELFPVTQQDFRTGRQHWHERVDVAKAVAKELFDKCSQPTPTVEKTRSDAAALARSQRVSNMHTSLRNLMTHPSISGGKRGRVDVDDVLLLFMKHWLVIRRHRRHLIDRALGLVQETPLTTTLGTPTSEASESLPLCSLDSFHTVVKRFEKLGRFAPAPSVSELIHSDAYMVALGLSRQKRNKALSQADVVKTAILSSPLLLWDVSGARQEQDIPPTFSVRAMRSWLLSTWSSYSNALQTQLPLLMQELQASADSDSSTTILGNGSSKGGAESTADKKGPDKIGCDVQTASRRGDNHERKQLARALEHAQAEVGRLDEYIKGLGAFEGDGRLGPIVGKVAQEKQPAPSPKIKKFCSRSAMERASEDLRCAAADRPAEHGRPPLLVQLK